MLKGGSGLGKMMIAQNLAQAALTAGFTVRFSTLAAALADLLGQESMPAFVRRLQRYTRFDLLVLDELGGPIDEASFAYGHGTRPRRRARLTHCFRVRDRAPWLDT